jgi:hypothetical protein
MATTLERDTIKKSMVLKLSSEQGLMLRLRGQRLALPSPPATASVGKVVKDLGGIQAQEMPAAALAIRARSQGMVAADVERARVQEKTILRTWGWRGTLHLLATEDLGWLMPLLGPVFIEAGRRRREELGLQDELYARSLQSLRDMLADRGPATRAEIVEHLAAQDIRIEGQARPYLLGRAALEGHICFGPERGAEPTYVLLSDWIDQEHVDKPLSEIEAYAEITRRFLSAYAPAAPKDQVAWSGLPASKIKAAWQQIAGQLIEVEVDGAPAWMLKPQAAWLDELASPTPSVRLLPRFDIYLLGYQNRDLSVPRQFAKRINAGGGILHPTVIVDGRAVGTWKSQQKRSELAVRVRPFDQLAPNVIQGLEAEVADLARFQGVQARLEIES